MVQTSQRAESCSSLPQQRLTLKAFSNPATREGTGVLQLAWFGINEPRCFPQKQSNQAEGMKAGEKVVETKKEEAYLFFSAATG